MRRALSLVLLLTGVLHAAPAQAAETRVVLTLRPSAALEQRPPATAQERQARAAATRPAAGRQDAVRSWLQRNGFTVERATAWTLTARGPSHLLTRRLPPALRGSVLSATAERRRPVESRVVPTGYAPEGLRQAYAAPAGGDGTTVATIQFSGWRERDAAVFADAAGIALQPGQVESIGVGGARTDQPDGSGGDFEVALDVQAVLGAAPQARQLVFVAPNTTAGAVAVYDAVATRAEQQGLTAVSISWGACELETDPALMASMEQSLARMTAAGATVFAASGDAGAYGCASEDDPDGRRAVDYPASSPSVLGVGGTTLRRDGAGWLETAWSQRRDGVPGYAGSGTGGGLSARFPAPPWQSAPLLTNGRRAVPDLAAVADPRTGVGVYGPDADGRRRWQAAGGTSLSAPLLAGQLASALADRGRTLGLGRLHVPLYAHPSAFRDVVRGDNLREQAAPGYDLATGLGSPQWALLAPLLLQPALFAPAATGGLSTPVTAYAPTGAGYGLAETAEAACAVRGPLPTELVLADGPDRVVTAVLAATDDSGCRTATRTVVLDRTPPTALAALTMTSRPGVLALSWRGDDPAPSAGLATVTWRLRRTDTGAVVASGTAARSGGLLRTVPTGPSYRLEVEARDRLGHTGPTALSEVV